MSVFFYEIETLFRMELKRIVPRHEISVLRTWKQIFDRKRRKLSSLNEQAVTLAQLRENLESSPLDKNRDIFVHAAFSQIGTKERAEDIINLFLEYVGPDTTVLFPAYPMAGSMIDWMKDKHPFDVKNSRSTMGILSEVFRKRPDVLRSLHPTHSVCAWGPRAHFYVDNHHKCSSPTAQGSPYAKLIEGNGQIVCLGSDVGKVTAYHVVEDIDETFPIETQHLEIFEKDVLLPDGTKITVKTKVLDPHLSPWRVDNFEPKLKEFRAYMLAYNCLKLSKFGAANLDIIEGKAFLEMLRDLARKGVTIYHRPDSKIVRKLSNFPL